MVTEGGPWLVEQKAWFVVVLLLQVHSVSALFNLISLILLTYLYSISRLNPTFTSNMFRLCLYPVIHYKVLLFLTTRERRQLNIIFRNFNWCCFYVEENHKETEKLVNYRDCDKSHWKTEDGTDHETKWMPWGNTASICWNICSLQENSSSWQHTCSEGPEQQSGTNYILRVPEKNNIFINLLRIRGLAAGTKRSMLWLTAWCLCQNNGCFSSWAM